MTVGFDGSWNPENIIIQSPVDLTSKLYRGGTVGYPHLKGSFRAVWDWDALSVTWQSRFIGESETFPNAPSEVADFNNIPTTWYHDVSAKYRWRNLTFFGGINNLADKKPPQVAFLFQGSFRAVRSRPSRSRPAAAVRTIRSAAPSLPARRSVLTKSGPTRGLAARPAPFFLRKVDLVAQLQPLLAGVEPGGPHESSPP